MLYKRGKVSPFNNFFDFNMNNLDILFFKKMLNKTQKHRLPLDKNSDLRIMKYDDVLCVSSLRTFEKIGRRITSIFHGL